MPFDILSVVNFAFRDPYGDIGKDYNNPYVDERELERKEQVLEIKTKSGKTITIKDGGKLVACEDCLRSHSFDIDIMVLDQSYKYRCKKCGFKGECKVGNKLEIGKEHLNNSPSCSEKEKNNPQFFKCSKCQQEKKQEEIEEDFYSGCKICKSCQNQKDKGSWFYGKCELCGEGISSEAGEKYDEKVDEHMWEKHGKNKQPNKQLQNLLSTLTQLQQYFTANNIHSITNENGNLIITFNQPQNNPNSPPPPQTITENQIKGSDSSLGQEQRTMWQKFKEYLSKIGKNKINKQELEKEIDKLKTTSEEKPKEAKILPWIIGGIGIIAILGIVIALIRKRKNKIRKTF